MTLGGVFRKIWNVLNWSPTGHKDGGSFRMSSGATDPLVLKEVQANKEGKQGAKTRIIAALILGYFGLAYAFQFFNDSSQEKIILVTAIVFIVLAFFVYRGNKYLIIIAMIAWTADRGYMLTKTTDIKQIALWLLLMVFLYRAYSVEKLLKEKTH